MRKHITFRLDEELVRAIDQEASRRGLTRSDFVTDVLMQELDVSKKEPGITDILKNLQTRLEALEGGKLAIARI